MAISAGDRVAMTAGPTPNQTLLGFNGVPPMFGVVAAAGLNVLWKDGTFALAIPSTALDKITDPDDDVAEQFLGKRVLATGYTNWGAAVCVDAYKRTYNDAGTSIQVLLLQNPSGEYYFEALAADCEVIS